MGKIEYIVTYLKLLRGMVELNVVDPENCAMEGVNRPPSLRSISRGPFPLPFKRLGSSVWRTSFWAFRGISMTWQPEKYHLVAVIEGFPARDGVI